MGNKALQCGYCGAVRDDEPLSGPPLCKRACGGGREGDGTTSMSGCDPAGCIFDDTIKHLGDYEQTAFRFAGSGNLAALRWVFVFGADHEVRDKSGTTLLHVACRSGSLSIVKDLVRRGLPIGVQDSAGWTPLHVASCMGRQDVILYLLRSGANPRCKNGRGQTPDELCSKPSVKEVVISSEGLERDGMRSTGLGRPLGPYSPQHAEDNLREGAGASLHFEPFFVPREPVICEPGYRNDLQHVGVSIFNISPGHGVAWLVATGAVRDYPVEINGFLTRVGCVDKERFGEYLGEDYSNSQTLRLEFFNSLPLLGTGVVSALQIALEDISMPSDWIKVDRLLRGIAHFWWRQHDEEAADRGSGESRAPLSKPSQGRRGAAYELRGLELHRCLLGTDVLHRLLFSALLLERHVAAGSSMSLNEWVHLNMGIEAGGADVPVHVQTGIYRTIAEAKEPLWGKPPAPVARAQRLDLEPRVACWAFVRYIGRSQASHGLESAAWPSSSLRSLVAEGGVASAGQAGPLPGCDLGDSDDAVPLPSASEVGTCGFAAPAARRRVRAMSALAQPLHKDAPAEDCSEDEETVWASLRGCALLLAHEPGGAPPFAFVWLQHLVLHKADPTKRCLFLQGRQPQAHQQAQWTGSDEWVDMCLLLGDGRFQPLEAPRLVLRFPNQCGYEMWAERLTELCPPEGAKPPGLRVSGVRLPASIETDWPKELGRDRKPPTSGGDAPAAIASEADPAAEGGSAEEGALEDRPADHIGRI
mmetsp:Transcript_38590/g.110910  ORF Transcript_38590/g.110910 Transcript_38590/m.110910 type:complete len:758 (-) Transcript_38590:2-2275(-)